MFCWNGLIDLQFLWFHVSSSNGSSVLAQNNFCVSVWVKKLLMSSTAFNVYMLSIDWSAMTRL